jgi:hypothetical protein
MLSWISDVEVLPVWRCSHMRITYNNGMELFAIQHVCVSPDVVMEWDNPCNSP